VREMRDMSGSCQEQAGRPGKVPEHQGAPKRPTDLPTLVYHPRTPRATSTHHQDPQGVDDTRNNTGIASGNAL